MNHVGLGKYAAAACNARRMLRGKRQPAELALNADPEARCLLVKK
jgi:hypothetical protein